MPNSWTLTPLHRATRKWPISWRNTTMKKTKRAKIIPIKRDIESYEEIGV
jgi:hypothetical protein